ncbi:MAG: hypothetical protein ACPIB6_08050, partial [Henriciella sp.]
ENGTLTRLQPKSANRAVQPQRNPLLPVSSAKQISKFSAVNTSALHPCLMVAANIQGLIDWFD